MTGYDRAVLTLLEPGALWLLLSLPVIVLLFFIRERRRQQEVSALFLWTEAALSARRRRRISPALLLLLQLLLAALLAFALAQPRVRLEGVMLSTSDRWRARACTHLDVDRAGIETALEVIRAVVAN